MCVHVCLNVCVHVLTHVHVHMICTYVYMDAYRQCTYTCKLFIGSLTWPVGIHNSKTTTGVYIHFEGLFVEGGHLLYVTVPLI